MGHGGTLDSSASGVLGRELSHYVQVLVQVLVLLVLHQLVEVEQRLKEEMSPGTELWFTLHSWMHICVQLDV